MKRKICVVTGSRSEYGLLQPLMQKLKSDHEIELQLVVIGMHLSPEFGITYKQVENDGFFINEKIESLLSSDTSVGVAKSVGLATIGLADSLNRLKPDILIILGDRFEMLAVAQTALIMQIPIAHIHGGECTFGAYDDAIRHAITKMSNLHFTSTENHRKRVIQLGENPSYVWNVGAIGIENIINISLYTKDELYDSLQLDIQKPIFLITYHPETNSESQNISPLLNALHKYDVNLVFTKANADNGGRFINEKIQQFANSHNNVYLFDSLGQVRYLSASKYAKVVIGNSSSALIEVPYLETPSVNIGSRQNGREKPSSVFDAKLETNSIQSAIEKALIFNGKYERIFGNGDSSSKIINILKELENYSIQKGFYDL